VRRLGFYKNREERARWLAEKYSRYLSGSVLDVGCWNRDLKKYLTKSEYIGIDIAGSPNLYVNLEKGLPFKDNSFDCVVATDVLEHLENIHFVFAELIRVSKRYVIISLPNCWASFVRALMGSLFKSESLKFYGLPIEKPNDRHRWFFNTDEAMSFVEHNAKRRGVKIKEMEVVFSNNRIQLLRRFMPRRIRMNIFAMALWVVLEKGGGER